MAINYQRYEGEWREALAKPFDAAALMLIKEKWERAKRQDETHSALYAYERAAFLRDLTDARSAAYTQVHRLSKAELGALIGFDAVDATRHSKDYLISLYYSLKVDPAVPHEHKRVTDAWALMTPAEKEDAAGIFETVRRVESVQAERAAVEATWPADGLPTHAADGQAAWAQSGALTRAQGAE